MLFGGDFQADVVVDCGGLLIAPSYIDLQINGAFGVDFSSAADFSPQRYEAGPSLA